MSMFINEDGTLTPHLSPSVEPLSTPSFLDAPDKFRVKTVVITLVGIILNIFACCLLMRLKPCGRKTSTPLMLMTLLVWVDLMALIIYTVRGALTKTIKSNFGIALHCNIFGFVNFFLPIASGFVAMLMSCDRFIALARPFQYKNICSPKKLIIAFAVMTFAAVVIAALPFFNVGSYQPLAISGNQLCKLFWEPNETVGETIQFSLYFSAAVCIVSVVLLCNIGVVVILFKLRRRAASVLSKDLHGKAKSEEIQFVWSMMLLTTLFTICWCPWVISIGTLKFGLEAGLKISIKSVPFLLANHLIDPLVFLVTHYLIRGRLREILCCEKNQTPTNSSASMISKSKVKVNSTIPTNESNV